MVLHTFRPVEFIGFRVNPKPILNSVLGSSVGFAFPLHVFQDRRKAELAMAAPREDMLKPKP